MLCILDLSPAPEKKPPSGSKSSSNPAEPVAESRTAPQVLSALAKSPASETKSTGPARRTAEVPVSEPVNIPEEPRGEPGVKPEAPIAQADDERDRSEYDSDEYEVVLGRRQIASWLFVGTLLIAMFSAASYYVGRMTAPNPLADLDGKSEPYVAPPPPEATIAPAGQDPQLRASPGDTPASTTPGSTTSASTTPGVTVGATPGTAAPPASSVSSVPGTILRDWNNPSASPVSGEPPLFANPQAGALYLQMGAVEKGIAVVLAEGLRRHGFNSLVAPGPTEKIFRVLIGPFATQDDFKRAKADVDAIDLGTFARRFQK